MSGNLTNHIELQSFDLYNRIEQIHRQPTAAPENIRAKYILLYKVLEQACYELTAGLRSLSQICFHASTISVKRNGWTPSDKYAIQTMRRNCNAAMRDDFRPVMEEYLYDLRAIVRFVSLAFDEDIPASLIPEIPHSNRLIAVRSTHASPIYAAAVAVDDTKIFAATDSDEDPFIIIDYAKGGYNSDMLYVKDLLAENLQLNLLDVHVMKRIIIYRT